MGMRRFEVKNLFADDILSTIEEIDAVTYKTKSETILNGDTLIQQNIF